MKKNAIILLVPTFVLSLLTFSLLLFNRSPTLREFSLKGDTCRASLEGHSLLLPRKYSL